MVATDLVNTLSLPNRLFVHTTNLGKVQKPAEGIYNQLWAVSAREEAVQPGAFYEPEGYLSPLQSKYSKDPELAKKLWEWTDAELAKWM